MLPVARKSAVVFAILLASTGVSSFLWAQGAATVPPDRITRNQPHTNSLGMRFVPVPGTEVLFSIWLTRVKDFEAFVKATGYDATAEMLSLRTDDWKKRGDNWISPGFAQGPDHPVCGVSWEDAKAFCDWLSKKEGKTYRLPTDTEWSHAVGIGGRETGATPEARNGRLRDVYPWGNSMPPLVNGNPAGNYAGMEAVDRNWPTNYAVITGFQDQFPRTSPVGSFPANALGLYDLGGNLWQWCEDFYEAGLTDHVLRGGSWRNANQRDLLSSYRVRYAPKRRLSSVGFRVVLAETENR